MKKVLLIREVNNMEDKNKDKEEIIKENKEITDLINRLFDEEKENKN